MKRIQALALFLALAPLGPGASRGQMYQLPPPVDIPIQNILQETPVWCWVAVAQQIIAAVAGPARTPPQCALVAIANNAHPDVCCRLANPACVVTGSFPQVRGLIAQFGGAQSALAPPTDAMTLYQTLASGRPIILEVQTGFASTHVVVLRGMSFVPTPNGPQALLHINDPMAYFTQPVPFQNLLPVWRSAIVVSR
ncbi:MAG: hypothetical protein H6511_02305 [Holophagales bacterium]|nr:hypothetical protein [Holophagales bacterium]